MVLCSSSPAFVSNVKMTLKTQRERERERESGPVAVAVAGP